MIKTRGRKNPTPLIALILIVLAAAALFFAKPVFRTGRKRPVHEAVKSHDKAPSGKPAEQKQGDQSADSSGSRADDRARIAIIIDDVGYHSPHLLHH